MKQIMPNLRCSERVIRSSYPLQLLVVLIGLLVVGTTVPQALAQADAASATASPVAGAGEDESPDSAGEVSTTDASGAAAAIATSGWNSEQRTTRAAMLIGSFTVFLLAVFVGFEIITKVPPTLHTPLMSGSNAISGITIVGAILTAGHGLGGFGAFLGMLAVILAMINVVGGFLVTHRMLMMFKKR
jgi:NAD(P) transhydrogenase subunit alpha